MRFRLPPPEKHWTVFTPYCLNHLQVSTKVAGTMFALLQVRRLSPPPARFLLRQGQRQPTGGSDLLHDTSLNGRCSIFPAAAKNAWNESAAGKAHTQCRTNSTLRSAGYACMANLARKTRLFVKRICFVPSICLLMLFMLQI